MLFTIEGTYKDGKIELTETPAGVQQAKVLVTFLTTETQTVQRRYMTYGQFAGERMSTEEDFHIAEWRGEANEPDGD
ncbi:MAG TPA: hypothetical protein VGX03_12390, partial [Candidatus Binatia bacterium]|jgi:hypothetical protein|nr:hypothetical protein [Candidatus Binatia bacterium]